MGKYGLSIDNLTAIEVVTSDGDVRIVDDQREPDLFWALRGGGGNFGVAASFEFVTHPLDTILGGILAHPLAAAGDVIGMYRQFAKELSDDASVFGGLTHAPDGSGMKLCAMPPCHAGTIAEAEAELRPLREFGPPVNGPSGPDALSGGQYHAGQRFPPGRAELLALGFLHRTQRRRRPGARRRLRGGAVADDAHLHRALTTAPRAASIRRPPPSPTVEPGFNLVLPGQWADPADTEVNVQWVRDTFAALEPYTAPRTLVNYAGSDQADEIVAFYGPNLDRLRDIKRRYDPDNVFHLNQNIPTGLSLRLVCWDLS